MAQLPDAESVETEDQYIHVRYRDPDRFEAIRTPDWADNVSDSVSEGSEVRMGKEGEDWKVQSVLIEKHAGEDKAEEQADEILRKIEE